MKEKNRYEEDLSYNERMKSKYYTSKEPVKSNILYKDEESYFIIDNFVIYYYDEYWRFQTSKMYNF